MVMSVFLFVQVGNYHWAAQLHPVFFDFRLSAIPTSATVVKSAFHRRVDLRWFLQISMHLASIARVDQKVLWERFGEGVGLFHLGFIILEFSFSDGLHPCEMTIALFVYFFLVFFPFSIPRHHAPICINLSHMFVTAER